MSSSLLKYPGRPGMWGALMDEYARAAEDFLRVAEAITKEQWDEPRASEDPDGVSLRKLCAHVILAARGYSAYIRKARGIADQDPRAAFVPPDSPSDLRTCLTAALHWTEDGLEGFYEKGEAALEGTAFQVRWGPTYDPEMILEHGIVHLLRHRRQIERW
ncbi:MAG: DinB family protein [Candidatus Eisenbacteria bacterium]|nr:DinB family protein [Candidatus Eisenbacteria bacterium]MCC7143172.1 DinB family protein [Candidatus Eisenbacteria bacterium]